MAGRVDPRTLEQWRYVPPLRAARGPAGHPAVRRRWCALRCSPAFQRLRERARGGRRTRRLRARAW